MKLPPLIFDRIAKFFLFIVCEVIAIILIANNGIVQRYNIMEGVRSFSSFFWKRSTAIKNYSRLRSINEELTKENQRLLEQNVSLKEQILKEEGKDKLDEFVKLIEDKERADTSYNYHFILARVIKNSINSQHNYLIIDKGEEDGIEEDLGVITPSGVVGITRGVGKRHTYVLSFLNEKQSISAKIGNSGVYGSLKWDGTNIENATLTEIPLNIPVTKDAVVYTSGNSSFFPSNIPIGNALGYTISNGTHKNVRVKLLQDFRNLDYVIIVKNGNRQEIDSLSSLEPISNR